MAERATTEFTNGLTDAEAERLAILAEELGEAMQAVGKILRHGYESYDPAREEEMGIEGQNRRDLEKELGDLKHAIDRMISADDLDAVAMTRRAAEKAKKIAPYLHHQGRRVTE